jgi:hypothetical protein
VKPDVFKDSIPFIYAWGQHASIGSHEYLEKLYIYRPIPSFTYLKMPLASPLSEYEIDAGFW